MRGDSLTNINAFIKLFSLPFVCLSKSGVTRFYLFVFCVVCVFESAVQ